MNEGGGTTDVLAELRANERVALDRLVPLVYEELRRIAHRHLAVDRGGTLQTTALVHEAYLKLVDQSQAKWNDRAHFMALASRAMRHILLDRAKARLALKRGGDERPLSLDDEIIAVDDQPAAMLQLNDALDELEAIEPRLARVVECRFFAGLADDEIAEALNIAVRTVQRDWAKAKVFLRRALVQ